MLAVLLIGLMLFQGCTASAKKTEIQMASEIDPNHNPRPIYNKSYSFEDAKTLDDIYEIYTSFIFDYKPEYLDFIGDVSAFGFENPKRYFPEFSTEAEAILKQVSEEAIDALEKISVEANSADFYDKEVLLWFLKDTLNQLNYPTNRFFAYPSFGAQANVGLILLDMHEIQTLSDAENYVFRIQDAGRYLNDVYDQVALSLEAGVYLPKTNALRLFSELNAERDNTHLYKSKLLEAMDSLDLKAETQEELLALYELSIDEYYLPALDRLIQQTSDMAKNSPFENGLSQYPNGKNYYESVVIPHHVGLPFTAEEIHQVGLDEVARITEELSDLLEAMGHTEDILRSIYAVQQNSEKYQGQSAVIQYEKTMYEMAQKLPNVFHPHNIPSDLPAVRFFGYNSYLQPSIDGNRRGYFNITNGTHSAYAIPALTIHEASPGHHLQITNVLNNPDMRLLRKLLRTTSYVEGWALYSEKMALETGFVESDDVIVGMLLSELFRAARLVVDTGLHAFDWTKIEAENYLKNVAYSDYYAFEVVRYMSWPGQALAYKMGELKILELRQEAMDALGDRFDLKTFHSAVLDEGYLPLKILELKVHAYIEEEMRKE